MKRYVALGFILGVFATVATIGQLPVRWVHAEEAAGLQPFVLDSPKGDYTADPFTLDAPDAVALADELDPAELRNRIERLERRVEELTKKASAAREAATTLTQPPPAEQLAANMPELGTAEGRRNLLMPVLRAATPFEHNAIHDYMAALREMREHQTKFGKAEEAWTNDARRVDQAEASKRDATKDVQEEQQDPREAKREGAQEEAQNADGGA